MARHSYDPEKKAAFTWWGARPDAIGAGKRSRVLAFATRRLTFATVLIPAKIGKATLWMFP